MMERSARYSQRKLGVARIQRVAALVMLVLCGQDRCCPVGETGDYMARLLPGRYTAIASTC
jgi:hypothetical protein